MFGYGLWIVVVCCVFETRVSEKRMVIRIHYSPPQSQFKEELHDHIINTIDHIRLADENASFIIMGDFNDFSSEPIERQTSLIQVVKQATRGNSVLDKILTDLNDSYLEPDISAPISFSDHSVVTLSPRIIMAPKTSLVTSLRPFRDSSIREFGQWITQMDWSALGDFSDPDIMATNLRQLINGKYRQYFELVTIKRRPNDKAWINNQLRRLIIQRDKAFKRGDQTYRNLRNRVQRMIKSAKTQFYSRKVEHLKQSEQGKWHQQIRHLTGQKKQSLCLADHDKLPLQIANDLNAHFAQICSKFPPLNISALTTYLPAPAAPVIYRHQVYKCLRQLNTSKACHPEDCPTRLLRESAYELAEPLTKIFSCLSSGIFPNIWKNASQFALYLSPLMWIFLINFAQYP